jgi:tetraacyldisaccharide 4'-kinase
MNIESLVVDLIEGRRKNFLLEKILYAMSLLYRFAVYIRNLGFDTKLISSYSSHLPVISVGNIVAGGTGKTPFVQKITSELSSKPGDVAIITRGYRAKAESSFVVASKGSGPITSALICGDEAYWLALNTKASIWVGRNRVNSLKQAEQTRAKVALLEDGFQHRQVQRDFEIVLLNAEDLLGKEQFLPRGYLRESPKSLSRAKWIVITYLKEGFCAAEILKKIRPFSKAAIIGLSASFELKAEIMGKKVGAFCGIAKPHSFYNALEDVEVVKTLTFPDHKVPSDKELLDFAQECKDLGAEYLICTEKDWVKLSTLSSLVLPIEVLKMQFKCIWNENIWKEMLESIQSRMLNLE